MNDIKYLYGFNIGILVEFIVRVDSTNLFAWICLSLLLLIVILDTIEERIKR
jgi:hypothetical protein